MSVSALRMTMCGIFPTTIINSNPVALTTSTPFTSHGAVAQALLAKRATAAATTATANESVAINATTTATRDGEKATMPLSAPLKAIHTRRTTVDLYPIDDVANTVAQKKETTAAAVETALRGDEDTFASAQAVFTALKDAKKRLEALANENSEVKAALHAVTAKCVTAIATKNQTITSAMTMKQHLRITVKNECASTQALLAKRTTATNTEVPDTAKTTAAAAIAVEAICGDEGSAYASVQSVSMALKDAKKRLETLVNENSELKAALHSLAAKCVTGIATKNQAITNAMKMKRHLRIAVKNKKQLVADFHSAAAKCVERNAQKTDTITKHCSKCAIVPKTDGRLCNALRTQTAKLALQVALHNLSQIPTAKVGRPGTPPLMGAPKPKPQSGKPVYVQRVTVRQMCARELTDL